MAHDKIHPAFVIFFSVLTIGFIVLFSLGQAYEAAHKPFWSDETFSLEQSIRPSGYLDLLTHGARGQGSPSPLDYLALKAMDNIKDRVDYFGLKPDVYFRLWSNVITALSAIGAVFILLRSILASKTGLTTKLLQIFLLSLIPFSYYFNTLIYYYAAEMRPYALWNSLWLIILTVGLVNNEKKIPLIVALSLLAMSATASIFQITAMLVAFVLVDYFQTRSLPRSGLQTFKIFTFPILVALYYSLRAGQWNYLGAQGGTWEDFRTLWVHESTVVPLMILISILCFVIRENRKYMIAPLSMLFLYFLGPLIYCLTRLKGFFYTERQYIYYDLTNTVFLMTLVQCLPGLLDRLKGKYIRMGVIVLALFIVGAATFRPKLVKKYFLNTGHAVQVIADPTIIGLSNAP